MFLLAAITLPGLSAYLPRQLPPLSARAALPTAGSQSCWLFRKLMCTEHRETCVGASSVQGSQTVCSNPVLTGVIWFQWALTQEVSPDYTSFCCFLWWAQLKHTGVYWTFLRSWLFCFG